MTFDLGDWRSQDVALALTSASQGGRLYSFSGTHYPDQ